MIPTFETEMKKIKRQKQNDCVAGTEEFILVPDPSESTLRLVCPECEEYRPEDPRVAAGMKCGLCAYGYGGY